MKNLTCTPATIQAPTVPGADIHTLSAAWVTNYTSFAPGDFNYNGGDVAVQSAKFCNITVTYTHPGYNDNITVETWLPASEQWNGRLQAIGGGGWAAGRFPLTGVFMDGALGEGYATTTTDAGLGLDTQGPLDWALLSPGNFDYVTLNNFAARALNDQALIGKGLIQSFYGRAPEYSYWSGCSQGGRQGMMLAQRYPTAYDGIAASAPAQSITKFTSNLYYPIFMRLWHGVDPLTCELDYLTKEAIKACDPLDGVTDGLISNMTACNYDPYTAVNKTFECAGLNRTIPLSQGAALVAQAAWSGAHTTDGRQLWYGYNPGTDITKFGAVPGQNSSIPSEDMWFNLFGAKNASFDTFAMSHEQYQEAFHSITQEFSSMFDAADPDLSAFKAAGGKLITYHGLADTDIPPKGTEHLYNQAQALTPDIKEFWRFFESPGLGHCSMGLGGQPTTVMKALREWVENGTAPATLPVQYPKLGKGLTRMLCPYPAQATYIGGDISVAESFRCA